jgi:mannan endo-1,4-beta-mannosidase
MIRTYSLWLCSFLVCLLFFQCNTDVKKNVEFITVQNGQFIKNNKPYYFIGTNYWYGAILGSDTLGGNRTRLIRELDFLKAIGIDNLRIMVGAEGPDFQPFRVTPALVKEPGVYSPKLLKGLDYLLHQMQLRNMCAVLYFTNNWEWSGGMAQYLNWNGYGEYVNPNLEQYSWNDFYNYQKQFYSCQPCISQVNHYIETIITRTNSITGIKYADDPTIMAWELANEPRPMATDNFEPFIQWIKNTSAFIKKLDPNHLVTTGNEGEKGCSESIELFETIHAFPSIDYITFHIWIKNWGWYQHQNADSTFPQALQLVQKYFDDHVAIAKKLNKPMVLEEFGMARDQEMFGPGTPTTLRDAYYDFCFNQIAQSVAENGVLAGANFWTFGGFTQPVKEQNYWKPGDPYSGDPPQEEQGLNSVYPGDSSTMRIILKYNQLFNR